MFSNNPPNITKRLPNSINKLLSRNSSSKYIFDNNKVDYQRELNKSSYKTKNKKKNTHTQKATTATPTVITAKTEVRNKGNVKHNLV